MRKFIIALGAVAVAIPAATVVPTGSAEARRYSAPDSRYYRKVCRKSPGNTGLIAGGVGGAVVGSSVIGGGLLGTAAGAVGGALAGRAIDRSATADKRCHYVRR